MPEINEKGELELQTITTHGRAFGLQQILDKLIYMANHLKKMETSMLKASTPRELSVVKMVRPFCNQAMFIYVVVQTRNS